jgi:hypothetical protein
MRGHCHLGFHIVWRSIEDSLPTGDEELILLVDTSLYNGPYFAAQDFGCNIWVSKVELSMAIRPVFQGDSCLMEYALESTFFFALYLAGHIS